MNILHIITRCTRTDNLQKIKESIFTTDKFSINWHICFDINFVKQIPTEILISLSESNCKTRFFKGTASDMGHQVINEVIDSIDSGWIYVLDDDNIIHEDFYEIIWEHINKYPESEGFIFNQKVGGIDFSGLDVRLASPENTKVQHIDMAQFILKRELIGQVRIKPNMYVADGIFIEQIYNDNPNSFIFIDKILCYYNKLIKKGSNSLPRILVVGTEEEIDLKSKYHADFESVDLNTLFIKNDKNIDEVIQNFNPDAIVSVGPSFGDFQNLSYHSLDVRGRWVHFENLNESVGEIAYECANNYILKNYDLNTPLISFFTPIYNTGEKLVRTYESVKNQNYTNWEWVLVNDSTDGGRTLKIAEEIAKSDSRVKVYDFGKKSGGIVGESKYRAASLSNGKYLMELDHDDYLTPDAGELMVKAFKDFPDAKFVYSDCAEIDENHNSLTYGDGFSFGYASYRDEQFQGRTYKTANTANINPKTIRHIVGVPNHFRAWDRAFYHSIGGHNRRLTIADDYELIVRTFLKTRMVRIPKLLYLQFYHNSNTQDASRKDIQRRVRSIANFYNVAIKNRFQELGKQDWAWDSNPNYPTYVESRFGESENYVNYIMDFQQTLHYDISSMNRTFSNLMI